MKTEAYRGQTRADSGLCSERGSALIIALMSLLLFTCLGLVLIVATNTETMISSNYQMGEESRYAADAALELASQELSAQSDFSAVFRGAGSARYRIGASAGPRTLPDGSTLDLTKLTNLMNCGKTAGCSDADMSAVTPERPWGANNPRWSLYAWGPLTTILNTGTVNSLFYVVVWAADDPAETDNDPLTDDAGGTNAGARGVLVVRAAAFGPFGVRRTLEATVFHEPPPDNEHGYRAQRGQGDRNVRALPDTVPTIGGALNEMRLNTTTGGMVVQ